MKTLGKNTISALAGAVLLATGGAVLADTMVNSTRAIKNYDPYQSIEEMQADLDAEQRDLNRRQMMIDRERARVRRLLSDASWRFKSLDLNDNGLLSMAEAEGATRPVWFKAADENKDGMLSVSEWRDASVRTKLHP